MTDRLIIQHIWMRWTKQSRGANARLERPRLEEAYALPTPAGDGPVLCHEIRAIEQDHGFAIDESFAPVDRDSWHRPAPWREEVLDWRIRKDRVEISISSPSEHRLQTKWPAFLPSPLFALRLGDVARIDWNGRLRMSMGDSNRSSYYEQHLYRLALADAPTPRLFLDDEPRKHIDLRTGIY
jgi:hypothetical protein